jgi:enediyne polyketide synthase
MRGEDGGRGAMLSVPAAPELLQRVLGGTTGYAAISNYNSPTQTVVSGDTGAIDAVQAELKAMNVTSTRLAVSNAFHSKYMTAASLRLREVLRHIEFDAPQRLLISSVTGDFFEDMQAVRALLAEQVTLPVRFTDAVSTLMREEPDAIVEVGPGTVLSGLLRGSTTKAIPFAIDEGMPDDCGTLNNFFAFLFACGSPLVLGRIFENRFVRSMALPYAPSFITSPCENPVAPLDLGGAPSVAAPPLAARADPPHEAVTTDASPAAWTAAGILAFLKDFISRRYGFPADYVTPTTRLGEDLNLDSIKSVEVIAELLAAMGLEANPTGWGPLPIEEITARLLNLANGPGRDPVIDATVREPEAAWVRAFRMRWVPAPLGGTERAPPATVVLVTDGPSAVVPALVAALDSRGIASATVDHDDTETLGPALERCAACLLFCAPHTGVEAFELAAADRDLALYRRPRAWLRAAKAFLASGTPRQQPLFLGAVVGRSRAVGTSEESASDGIGGFIRSVHLENPAVITRVIDLDPELDAVHAAASLLAEITHGDGHLDVAFTGDDLRHEHRFEASPPPVAPAEEFPAGPQDVLLVTGGARGITAECALALVQGRGVKVAVVGTSKAATDAGLQPSPGHVDEVSRNLERFKQAGIRVPSPVSFMGWASTGPIASTTFQPWISRRCCVRR